MKLQQFNLISIIAAVVAGVFGAFPVSVHANKSPLIAMTVGGLGVGVLPVTVHAKKSPLVALAAGVGISTLPEPVHAGDNKCTRGDYGCGQGIGTRPYWTESCSASQCCCVQTDFGGYRHSTCEGYQSVKKGCNSCLGEQASERRGVCENVASTVEIGDESCVNMGACYHIEGNSVIWNHSCRAKFSCWSAKNVVIKSNSCGIGKDAGYGACEYMEDSTVGANSCRKSILVIQVQLLTFQSGTMHAI